MKMNIKQKIFSKTIDYGDGFSETKNEKRFVIVDDDGKIIDDAQGYGYKTYNNAAKAFWYKNNRSKYDENNKNAREIIKKYRKELNETLNYTNDECFISECKDGEKFDYYGYFWAYFKSEYPDIYKDFTEDKNIKKSIIKILLNE